MGPLGNLVTYRTGVDIAADYNAILPNVLFKSDMPGMPGELTMLFTSTVHMEDRPVDEALLDEELTKKAIDRAMEVEREGAKKAIQEYERSIEEMKRQLDQQNNELRMAQVSVSELTAKISDLANRLKGCQDEARERGDTKTETELDESRNKVVQVYSDITSLSSTLGRLKDDNEDAMDAAEGVDTRATIQYQRGREDHLAAIRKGVSLRPRTPLEQRESEDDTSIAAILQRRIALAPIPSTPYEAPTSDWDSDAFESAGAGAYIASYYRMGNRRRSVQYVSPDISHLEHIWCQDETH